jgi:hypothetical protein
VLAVRRPESDVRVALHVLPHGPLQAVAEEIERDLSDPSRHRRFSLAAGTREFTEHWLVLDGSVSDGFALTGR